MTRPDFHEERLAGQLAFQTGDKNPWIDGCEEHDAWAAGWAEAQEWAEIEPEVRARVAAYLMAQAGRRAA